MNRRNFFKALISVGASTALAESLLVKALATPVAPTISLMTPEAKFEFEMLKSFIVYGAEDVFRLGSFALRRVGFAGDLMRVVLNTHGNYFHWVARPEEVIIIHREHPVEILADLDGVANLSTETETGELRQYYWSLTRSNCPRLLQTITSPKPVFLPRDVDESTLDAWEQAESDDFLDATGDSL